MRCYEASKLFLQSKNEMSLVYHENQSQPAWMDLMRHLIQRLRDISKRVDLQISETTPRRLIKEVSTSPPRRL